MLDKKQKPGSKIHHPKSIIFIQDAHDSLEAQENIAKTIQYLVKRHGVKTVFEEGFEGPVPTDKYFGMIKDPVIREKVSYFLMDKLRLGGAEYAHINRKGQVTGDGLQVTDDAHPRHPIPDTQFLAPETRHLSAQIQSSSLSGAADFTLIGADSSASQRANIEQYRRSAQYRAQTQRDLDAIRKELDRLINRYFPKRLKVWMKLRARLDENRIGLMDYVKRIVTIYEVSGVRSRVSEKNSTNLPIENLNFPSPITQHLKTKGPVLTPGPRHLAPDSFPYISLLLAVERQGLSPKARLPARQGTVPDDLAAKLQDVHPVMLFEEISRMENELAEAMLRGKVEGGRWKVEERKTNNRDQGEVSGPGAQVPKEASSHLSNPHFQNLKSDFRHLTPNTDSLPSETRHLRSQPHLSSLIPQDSSLVSFSLFRYDKILRLIERLNRLEVSSSEFEAVKGMLEEFKTAELVPFMVRHGGQSLVLSRRWEENIQKAIGFYAIARERDRAIEKRLSEFAADPKERTAVLVFGGFHKDAVKEILKKNHFSYVIISPKIRAGDEQHKAYYKQLMTVGRYPYEPAVALQGLSPKGTGPFVSSAAQPVPSTVRTASRPESRIQVWEHHPLSMARAEIRVMEHGVNIVAGSDTATANRMIEAQLRNIARHRLPQKKSLNPRAAMRPGLTKRKRKSPRKMMLQGPSPVIAFPNAEIAGAMSQMKEQKGQSPAQSESASLSRPESRHLSEPTLLQGVRDYVVHPDFNRLFGLDKILTSLNGYPPLGESALFLNHSVAFAREGIFDEIVARRQDWISKKTVRQMGIGPGAGIDALTAIYQTLMLDPEIKLELDLVELPTMDVTDLAANVRAALEKIFGYDIAPVQAETGEIYFDLAGRGIIRIFQVAKEETFSRFPSGSYDLIFFNAPTVLAGFADPRRVTSTTREEFNVHLSAVARLLSEKGIAIIGQGGEMYDWIRRFYSDQEWYVEKKDHAHQRFRTRAIYRILRKEMRETDANQNLKIDDALMARLKTLWKTKCETDFEWEHDPDIVLSGNPSRRYPVWVAKAPLAWDSQEVYLLRAVGSTVLLHPRLFDILEKENIRLRGTVLLFSTTDYDTPRQTTHLVIASLEDLSRRIGPGHLIIDAGAGFDGIVGYVAIELLKPNGVIFVEEANGAGKLIRDQGTKIRSKAKFYEDIHDFMARSPSAGTGDRDVPCAYCPTLADIPPKLTKGAVFVSNFNETFGIYEDAPVLHLMKLAKEGAAHAVIMAGGYNGMSVGSSDRKALHNYYLQMHSLILDFLPHMQLQELHSTDPKNPQRPWVAFGAVANPREMRSDQSEILQRPESRVAVGWERPAGPYAGENKPLLMALRGDEDVLQLAPKENSGLIREVRVIANLPMLIRVAYYDDSDRHLFDLSLMNNPEADVPTASFVFSDIRGLREVMGDQNERHRLLIPWLKTKILPWIQSRGFRRAKVQLLGDEERITTARAFFEEAGFKTAPESEHTMYFDFENSASRMSSEPAMTSGQTQTDGGHPSGQTSSGQPQEPFHRRADMRGMAFDYSGSQRQLTHGRDSAIEEQERTGMRSLPSSASDEVPAPVGQPRKQRGEMRGTQRQVESPNKNAEWIVLQEVKNDKDKRSKASPLIFSPEHPMVDHFLTGRKRNGVCTVLIDMGYGVLGVHAIELPGWISGLCGKFPNLQRLTINVPEGQVKSIAKILSQTSRVPVDITQNGMGRAAYGEWDGVIAIPAIHSADRSLGRVFTLQIPAPATHKMITMDGKTKYLFDIYGRAHRSFWSTQRSFMETLGFPISAADKDLIHITPGQARNARKKLKEQGYDFETPLAVLSPQGHIFDRATQNANWVMAAKILQRNGYAVAVNQHATKNSPALARLREAVKQKRLGPLYFIGENFYEMVWAIRDQMDLMVGNHSGIGHVAQILGKPHIIAMPRQPFGKWFSGEDPFTVELPLNDRYGFKSRDLQTAIDELQNKTGLRRPEARSHREIRSPSNNPIEALAGNNGLDYYMRQVLRLIARHQPGVWGFPRHPLSRVGAIIFDREGRVIGQGVNHFAQAHAERVAILDAFQNILNTQDPKTRPAAETERIRATIDYLRLLLKISRSFPSGELARFAWLDRQLGHPLADTVLFNSVGSCRHCAKLVFAAGIRYAVFGMMDDQQPLGEGGRSALTQNGWHHDHIRCGILEQEARRLFRFYTFLRHAFPAFYHRFLRELHRNAYAVYARLRYHRRTSQLLTTIPDLEQIAVERAQAPKESKSPETKHRLNIKFFDRFDRAAELLALGKWRDPEAQPDFIEWMQTANSNRQITKGVDLGAGNGWFGREVEHLTAAHFPLEMSGTDLQNQEYLTHREFLEKYGKESMGLVSINAPHSGELSREALRFANKLVKLEGIIYFSSTERQNDYAVRWLLVHGYQVTWVHFKNGPSMSREVETSGVVLASRGNSEGMRYLADRGFRIVQGDTVPAHVLAYLDDKTMFDGVVSLNAAAADLNLTPEDLYAALEELRQGHQIQSSQEEGGRTYSGKSTSVVLDSKELSRFELRNENVDTEIVQDGRSKTADADAADLADAVSIRSSVRGEALTKKRRSETRASKELWVDLDGIGHVDAFPSENERNMRGIPAITVDVLPSMNGLGDVALAFRLAQRLKKEFPGIVIRLVFEFANDFNKLRQIHGHIPEDMAYRSHAVVDGIVLINSRQALGEVDLDVLLGRSKITIISQLMIDHEDTLSKQSAVNIYLKEPEGGEQKRQSSVRQWGTGKRWKDNVLYREEIAGITPAYHFIIPTGFGRGSGGILLEDVELLRDHFLSKTQILQAMAGQTFFGLFPSIEETAGRRWGVAYPPTTVQFQDFYLDPLRQAIDEGHVSSRQTAIFDLGSRDMDPFLHDFTQVTFYPNRQKWYEDAGHRYPDVKVYHTGSAVPDRLAHLSLLHHSDLPILGRGDAIAGEITALDALPIWSVPPWKTKMPKAMAMWSANHLTEGEVRILLDLNGIGSQLGDWKADISRLFYDAGYQNAVHHLNRAIAEHHDLIPNLVAKIRELADLYDRENILPAGSAETSSEEKINGRHEMRDPDEEETIPLRVNLEVPVEAFRLGFDRNAFLAPLTNAHEAWGEAGVAEEILDSYGALMRRLTRAAPDILEEMFRFHQGDVSPEQATVPIGTVSLELGLDFLSPQSPQQNLGLKISLSPEYLSQREAGERIRSFVEELKTRLNPPGEEAMSIEHRQKSDESDPLVVHPAVSPNFSTVTFLIVPAFKSGAETEALWVRRLLRNSVYSAGEFEELQRLPDGPIWINLDTLQPEVKNAVFDFLAAEDPSAADSRAPAVVRLLANQLWLQQYTYEESRNLLSMIPRFYPRMDKGLRLACESAVRELNGGSFVEGRTHPPGLDFTASTGSFFGFRVSNGQNSVIRGLKMDSRDRSASALFLLLKTLLFLAGQDDSLLPEPRQLKEYPSVKAYWDGREDKPLIPETEVRILAFVRPLVELLIPPSRRGRFEEIFGPFTGESKRGEMRVAGSQESLQTVDSEPFDARKTDQAQVPLSTDRYPAPEAIAQMPIEDLTLPAAVILDAGELMRMSESQISDHLEEILALVRQHRAFDVYLDRADRYPVNNLQIPKLQKLFNEFPGRVHIGMFDQTNLNRKSILIHASFFSEASTAEETRKAMNVLKQKLQLKKDILPLDYSRAGAVRAFLSVAEMLKGAALIRKAGEAIAAFAVYGLHGRWQIAGSFLNDVWADFKNNYVVAWSA